MKRFSFYIALATIALASCRKDTEAEIKDVPFTSDKTTAAANTDVTFTIGDGADALSIYTGDAAKNFEFSRINLVELKGYTEEQLKTTLFALRIPDLKEYMTVIPRVGGVPTNWTYTGPSMDLYEGKLVPWDVSNATQSKYVRLRLADGNPQTLTIKPDGAVLPGMLNYAAAQLTSLRALNTVPNNNISPFASFPDGFDTLNTTGQSVRFGVQLVIDGMPTTITYFTQPVRELLDNLGFNVGAALTAWRTANPTRDPKKGIDELRIIFNADNPAVTDDDGDLLSYKGNVYIQELRIGDAANMVRQFDEGIAIPFVYSGTTRNHVYRYTTPGTYTATLVATYIGRKKYSGDGYNSNRANEISAGEYDIQRRYRRITITVQ